MSTLVKPFKNIALTDLPEVGGKNASLGELYNNLSGKGILVPGGFATTAFAFWSFLGENNIDNKLVQLVKGLDKKRYTNLKEVGRKAREIIYSAALSNALENEIRKAYRQLSGDNDIAVAVRSGATAEDLP